MTRGRCHGLAGLRGLLAALTLTAVGCDGSGASSVGTITAGAAGAPASAGQGGQSAGGAAAGGSGASPVCLRVEPLPAPVGEADQGRLFLRRPDGLWLLSGTSKVSAESDVTGGIFRWEPGSAWERHPEAALGDALGTVVSGQGGSSYGSWMAGASWAASIDSTPAFASVSLMQYDPEELETRARPPTDQLHWMSGSPLSWEHLTGGSGALLGSTGPSIVYPAGARTRQLTFNALGDPEVLDIYPDNQPPLEVRPPPAGLDPLTPVDNLRWTAAQRWHVRSGRGLPVAVLDLDALVMTPFTDLPPLLGDVAVDTDGPVVWLFGGQKGGESALYRVDASLAQAESVPLVGLPPAAGKPWHEAQSEDVLVALDAQHLWLVQARFGQLTAHELDLTTGQVYPIEWQGDVSAAEGLFEAPPIDGPDARNGFRPGDTLRAVAWSADEALVMRQSGPFAGVRVRRGCAP